MEDTSACALASVCLRETLTLMHINPPKMIMVHSRWHERVQYLTVRHVAHLDSLRSFRPQLSHFFSDHAGGSSPALFLSHFRSIATICGPQLVSIARGLIFSASGISKSAPNSISRSTGPGRF